MNASNIKKEKCGRKQYVWLDYIPIIIYKEKKKSI